jgi:dUTP pyrophosphatase
MSCKCGCFQKVKIVTDNPNQFQKNHDTDGGYDILASESVVIHSDGQALITTGLKVAIPKGYVGLIKSRSGLAAKHGLETGAGVIDHGYTGEIRVLLHNFSAITYRVDATDKIAQMVIVPICTLPVELVESLEDSERGEKGFNSSGY